MVFCIHVHVHMLAYNSDIFCSKEKTIKKGHKVMSVSQEIVYI